MFFCQISHLGARETRRSGEAHAARRHASPQLTLEQHSQPSYLNSALLRLVKVIDFEIAERLYI